MSALTWFGVGAGLVIALGSILTFSAARELPHGQVRSGVEIASLVAAAAGLAAVALIRWVS